MSANCFFAHFQFSNLNFMLEKKHCNDEDRYFAPHFIRHFQIASFFRFMQPNKRFHSIFILARPLYCVYLIPCFSFASAKTLSSFLAFFVSFFHSDCTTDFFDLLHVVFPYMTRNYFYGIFTSCATLPMRTALANKPVTFILPIPFTVCCGVMKRFVIRA